MSSLLSTGQLDPSTFQGAFNQIAFVISQLLSKVQTATLVRIDSCTNDGGLTPVGFVDVTPLVNQIDGAGNATPHTTIYNVPYLRMQGGANAVILDPQVGDIGVAVFGSRDLSKVINTKAAANPGSFRTYDFSDALYLGGMLNAIPSQYVQFQSSGITVVSPTKITMQAPTIALEGNVTMSEGLTVTNDVVAGEEMISLTTHTHTSEAPGSPTSPPLP